MNARASTVLRFALGLLAIVLLMANSLVFVQRVDLTEGGLYTLSPFTRELIDGLQQQVTITYYLSERLDRRFPQPQEIVDLLEEYEALSRGRIGTRVVDPITLERPEEVEAVGVVPQQLQISEEGEQRLATVYSGIVIDSVGRRESLPFVFSAAGIEYDVTSAVASLVRDDPYDLAVLTGDPTESLESDYQFAAGELSRSYDIRRVQAGAPIADDVELVLVTDAQRLDTRELSRVTEYLDRGGAVLFTVERFEIDLEAGLSALPADDAPVFRFLRRRGIAVGESLVLDESHGQIRVEEVSGDFRVTRAYPYPHWPVTLEQYTDPDHPVTARHAGLNLFWPTWLELDGDVGGDRLADFETEIIVATTPRAWLMRDPVVINPQLGGQFGRDANETNGQYGLVAAVRSGDGGPRFAVVSDVDFLRDAFISASGSSYNALFAQNLAQWLTNDVGLLEVRTRFSRSLTLDAIDEPQRERTVEFVARTVNLVLVPAAVAIVGIVRLSGRRRRSRSAGRANERA